MNVCFFIPTLNTAGGAERVIVTLANYLVKHNHLVRILTIKDTISFFDIDDRVDIIAICNKTHHIPLSKIQRIVFYIMVMRRFIRLVKEYKSDIIVSFLSPTNHIAIASRKFIRIPVVVSERNDPTAAGRAVLRKINKIIYPKADVIICQGEKSAEFYRAVSNKCIILPNPLNSSALGTFVSEKNNRIVTVGRIVPEKNQKMLIDAFAMIHSQHRGFILDIIGEGPLQEELEKKIKSLDLNGIVKIHKPMKNVMTKVNDGVCFVLPSCYEGFPNTLIEAMASGMPVVSTDFATGIARELIKDGKNGFVFPVDDKDKMIKSIETIITSPELQKKMGLENLKIRERFDETIICSKWERTLIGIVDSNK